MKWTQISADQPALGRVAHDRMIKPGVILLGTTRRDGPEPVRRLLSVR